MNKLPYLFLAALTLFAFSSVAEATITDNNVPKTYAITQFTEILFKGQRSTLAALQPGMSVSITLGSDATKAARINASDPPAPPAGKK